MDRQTARAAANVVVVVVTGAAGSIADGGTKKVQSGPPNPDAQVHIPIFEVTWLHVPPCISKHIKIRILIDKTK